MKYFPGKFSFLLLTATVILNSACSSDDNSAAGITYDGNTDPAIIDADNVEAIALAAGEAVQKADASTNLPGGITVINSSPVDMTEINGIVLDTVNNAANNTGNTPAGVEISGICTTGTVSTDNTAEPVEGQPSTTTLTFSSCVIGDKTFTGTAIVHFDAFGDLDAGSYIKYNNFTVTDANGTTTINMTIICNADGCTINSDYIGSDGITHRISEFHITGDATAGFNGDAIFFHGTFGEVSIIAAGITYGSCGTHPDGGTIDISSSNGSSASIIFNSDCIVTGAWSGIGGASSGTF